MPKVPNQGKLPNSGEPPGLSESNTSKSPDSGKMPGLGRSNILSASAGKSPNKRAVDAASAGESLIISAVDAPAEGKSTKDSLAAMFAKGVSQEREAFESKVDNRLNARIPELVKDYIETDGRRLLKHFHDFEKELVDKQDQVTDLDRNVIELKKFAADLSDQFGNKQKELDGFRASIVESLKLDAARKLWGDRTKEAALAFWLSVVVLLVLLVCIPVWGIYEADWVLPFFKKVSQSVVTDLPIGSDTIILISAVSRLVLITLPLALYVWLIRIVVRFNMRSLLLMDDAAQRNTMLDTYLHLVEQDATVKAERPLILEALFRRTPGHGSDTIDPPNLADIMKLSGQKNQP